MKVETINIYEGRNDVTLTTYVLDDSKETRKGAPRPAVLICPGGAYLNCSDREAEPVAMRFVAMGYHAFVLRYSVYFQGEGGFTDMPEQFEIKPEIMYPAAMIEIAKALKLIEKNAEKWHVDMEKVALCGFSAGAHNCGMYAVYWNQSIITEKISDEKPVKPTAVILGYPLTDYVYMKSTMKDTPITEGLFTLSNLAYLGTAEPTDEQLDEVSPARHISKDVPPIFLWATSTDELVPVQHSLVMAKALADHHIPFEMHIFEEGSHGLSLGTQATAESIKQVSPEIQPWMQLAEKWLLKRMAYKLPEKTDMELMMEQLQEEGELQK